MTDFKDTSQSPDKSTGRQLSENSPPIKSFVRHHGRLTDGQRQALTEYWPAFGIDFTKRRMDMGTIAEKKHPQVVLEIGFGNGESFITMAKNHPETLFIGAEVHRPGVGRALLLAQENACQNVKIIAHDAVEFIEHMLPDNCLDRVQLFFPDPWHKKRHFKRRLVQPHFCRALHRVLKPDAIFHVATDWVPYAEHVVDVMASLAGFSDITNNPKEKPSYRPETKFERRGLKLGHEVRDLCFKTVK